VVISKALVLYRSERGTRGHVMKYIPMKTASLLGLFGLTLMGSLPSKAEVTCTTDSELLVLNHGAMWTPCNAFRALYIHNNMEKIDFANYAPPEPLQLAGLAIQMFVFRRDHLDEQDGMVDHLIAAVPFLNDLDEERFYIYSSYIVFNYGQHAANGRDYTGALNPSVVGSGLETRFAKADDIVCFVEVDVPTLPIDEVINSPRYKEKCHPQDR
jgi:hypothetical protein